MEEVILAEIKTLLKAAGYDVIEASGEWPLEVTTADGDVFGLSIEMIYG